MTGAPPRVLVVDDEPAVRFTLEEALAGAGFEVVSAHDASDALARLDGVAAVITDLVMPGPGGDGLALAAKLRELDADLPVILLTARGSEATAVAAMKAGVHDYLTKPFAIDELRLVVARAVETHELRRARNALALERVGGHAPIGEHPAFRALLQQVRRAGRHDVTVLVRGETGTGKELVAAALHAESPRREGPLVRFNCGAIPASLAEAELFGHVKGAFTGASSDRRGYFAEAHGGTLVLDEVGELPASVQAALLRALASGEIQRVGASRIDKVDVRVVAATNRDLRAEVAAGRFREDLYYRLAVVELHVPPLRERRADIPLLIAALHKRLAARGLPAARFDDAVIAALTAREWPGNVRELENAVARLLALAEDGEVIGTAALAALDPGATPARDSSPMGSLRTQVDAFERDLLARTLAATQHNQSETARRLGLTRTTLIDKMKRHGLGREKP